MDHHDCDGRARRAARHAYEIVIAVLFAAVFMAALPEPRAAVPSKPASPPHCGNAQNSADVITR